jgi:hypothetical protein
MNSKTNHIKPAFAPEIEFHVETLTMLSGNRADEDSTPPGDLHLSTQNETDSWPTNSFSALND